WPAGWRTMPVVTEPPNSIFQRWLDLATVGGDGQLTAHVMGSMSHLALHQGEPAAAISLACQGQGVLAAVPPNPGLAARLLAMEARGLAALPQPEPATCGKVLLLRTPAES